MKYKTKKPKLSTIQLIKDIVRIQKEKQEQFDFVFGGKEIESKPEGLFKFFPKKGAKVIRG